MSDTVKDEHLALVRQLSDTDLSPVLASEGKISDLIKRVAAQKQAVVDQTGKLAQLREEDKGAHFLKAWWNDTDDKLKDGQLDVMASLSGLQSVSAELLVVNSSISKVLLSQQETLLDQQRLLEKQARRLNEQGDLIGEQQASQRDRVDEMLEANHALDHASREAMDLAARLVQGIVDVEAAEQRLTAQTTSQRDDLGAQIRTLRWGLGLALLLSAGAVLIALMRG